MRWLSGNSSPMTVWHTWDPMKDFSDLLSHLTPVSSGWPAVEIAEDESSYMVSVETPGFDKDQIEVEVREATLVIRGKVSDEKNSKRQLFSERTNRSFERAFRLPEVVDTTKAAAQYDKGVLTISLPKLETHNNATRIAIK